MPTLEEVYQKFGFVAEAAQLLETQLGTMLLLSAGAEQGWFFEPDVERATELHDNINRSTLGQLIRRMKSASISLSAVETLLSATEHTDTAFRMDFIASTPGLPQGLRVRLL